MSNGAGLTGFTLSNGIAGSGGGIYCASTTNVIVSNCVITANAGGGAYQGEFNNCTIIGNSGGGANYAILTNCTVASNIGGSGVAQCFLVNCSVTGNSATGQFSEGGGAYYSTLINCAISGNSVEGSGGGAAFGTLVNCTVIGNTAKKSHGNGGTYLSYETNCIIYYNTSGSGLVDNYQQGSGSLDHCCTTPANPSTAIITNEPLLASLTHISLNSPCRGAGKPASAIGVDADGEPWANPPSIGCDELYAGAVTGDPTVAIVATYTNIAPGYTNAFQANISGAVYASRWDFDDGTVVSNEPYMSYSWSTLGDHHVMLTAYNDTHPMGQTAIFIVHVYQPVILYVTATNPAAAAPYDTWAKAATNIQNALDMAIPGSLVLVSNGVYQTGSRNNFDGVASRVAVTNAVTLQSVNGAAVTTIDGGQTMRCIYLTNGATLIGFTLSNGIASKGAGVRCETNATVWNCQIVNNAGYGAYSGIFSNCTFVRNSTVGSYLGTLTGCAITNNGGDGAQNGTLTSCVVSSNQNTGAKYCALNNCLVASNGFGGIKYSVAYNCLMIGNVGTNGGAYDCSLTNCTLAGHASGYGAYYSNLKNCIVYYNSGSLKGGGATNCCIQTPASGINNFTNPPLFVNVNNDFHLQAASPCINSGNNAFIAWTNDFDGNPRIQGGTVDIGAYEYQAPSSVLSYAWAQQYGLPTDGSADYLDLDGTGMNNRQKWIAGLNPTNPASVLVLLSPILTNAAGGVSVSWQSVGTRLYYLQRTTNLTAPAAFSALQSNLVGQAGVTTFLDVSATNGGPYFYRVGVQ
ncbi:MAG: choice-of-anchor Q domain-containing protein [Verrucomicrobiae bacterium]|nr:choice-of-anchor Q domain-containing protein [Verrucomicrobiae bacterium]